MKKVKRTLMDGYVQFEDGSYGWYSPFKEEYIPVHEDEASAHEPDMYLDDIDDFDDEVGFTPVTEIEKAAEIVKNYYEMYQCPDSSCYFLNEEAVYADAVFEELWRNPITHEKYYEYYKSFMEDLRHDMVTACDSDDYDTLDTLSRIWIDCRALEV